jgi:hypothetical protein
MKKLVVFFLVTVFLSTVLLAHGEEKTGILADTKCGTAVAGDSAKAAGHKVACALSPGCKATGFGIIADGQFYPFDEAGNTQALVLLKATEKESALKVRVKGHFEEDLIKVSSMKAVD